MIRSAIVSNKNDREAGVGADNRLYVGPSSYSTSFNGTLGTDDTVVNIVPAKADSFFVLTDIILKGNKNIDPNTDATVDLYEANSDSSATSLQTIMSVPIERSGRLVLNGVFVSTAEGTWINGKTSDDDVFVTIFGYYVKNDEV